MIDITFPDGKSGTVGKIPLLQEIVEFAGMDPARRPRPKLSRV